jgi:hypothetical protein
MTSAARFRTRVLALTCVVALGHAACAMSGSYAPLPSHRIARIDSNEGHFVRDGKRFELGLVGDAAALVRGNDFAVQRARSYRRNQIAALAIYGVGLGMLGAGIGLSAGARQGSRAWTAGDVLWITSLIPVLASIPFLLAARRNLLDAVNIYNDGLEGPVGPYGSMTVPGL